MNVASLALASGVKSLALASDIVSLTLSLIMSSYVDRAVTCFCLQCPSAPKSMKSRPEAIYRFRPS
jgi:hypothetical protein